MTIKTYSQEQINTVASSYEQEVCKLLDLKSNYSLAILNLKNQLSEKDKKISELEKQIVELTPKKKK